jgi:hypothetical protein
MPEQFLNGLERYSTHHEVTGERMAKVVPGRLVFSLSWYKDDDPMTDEISVDAPDQELQAELKVLVSKVRDTDAQLANQYTGEHLKGELRIQRKEDWKQMEYLRAELSRRQTIKLQQSANELVGKYVDLTGNYVRLTRLLVVVAALSILVTLLTWWLR